MRTEIAVLASAALGLAGCYGPPQIISRADVQIGSQICNHIVKESVFDGADSLGAGTYTSAEVMCRNRSYSCILAETAQDCVTRVLAEEAAEAARDDDDMPSYGGG